MWKDVTPNEILSDYEQHPYKQDNPLKGLNFKERAHLRAEVEGVSPRKYGYKLDKKLLTRPKVTNAIDIILERAGLSDQKLSKRLKEIIFKGKGANADNTAHNAIRTVFQLKGKFAAERHEFMHRSDMAQLSEDQLDMIIKKGVKEYTIAKVKLGDTEHIEESPSTK